MGCMHSTPDNKVHPYTDLQSDDLVEILEQKLQIAQKQIISLKQQRQDYVEMHDLAVDVVPFPAYSDHIDTLKTCVVMSHLDVVTAYNPNSAQITKAAELKKTSMALLNKMENRGKVFTSTEELKYKKEYLKCRSQSKKRRAQLISMTWADAAKYDRDYIPSAHVDWLLADLDDLCKVYQAAFKLVG